MSATQGGSAGASLGAHSKDAMVSGGSATGTHAGPPGGQGVSGNQSAGAALDQAQEPLQQLGERIKEQPLASVLIAAGIGYLVGRVVG